MLSEQIKAAWDKYIDFLNAGETPEMAEVKAGLYGTNIIRPDSQHADCGGWLVSFMRPPADNVRASIAHKCAKCKTVVEGAKG